MPSQPIFRFAPSPNGYLHLGHAFSALFTWRAADTLGGTTLLRIENIDTTRCKPEYDASVFEDLFWLGLTWPEPVMRQSGRFSAYREAAKKLEEAGLIYPCFCSRAEIAEKATGRDPDGAPLYPGTCRHLSAARINSNLTAGVPVQWRLDMDRALAEIGARGGLVIDEIPVEGHELLPEAKSARVADPARWGDVVLVRKETPTSYHLSVVVDDAAQGVTHVTRGMDLFAATDIHVLLQRLLGLPSPVYAHHRLITDAHDIKLAKSSGSPPLRLLREAGWTPADVRRHLGFA
jgi:glutamyl-Q tRNA(Asp) synthetase